MASHIRANTFRSAADPRPEPARRSPFALHDPRGNDRAQRRRGAQWSRRGSSGWPRTLSLPRRQGARLPPPPSPVPRNRGALQSLERVDAVACSGTRFLEVRGANPSEERTVRAGVGVYLDPRRRNKKRKRPNPDRWASEASTTAEVTYNPRREKRGSHERLRLSRIECSLHGAVDTVRAIAATLVVAPPQRPWRPATSMEPPWPRAIYVSVVHDDRRATPPPLPQGYRP
jgi:hypothetical protein